MGILFRSSEKRLISTEHIIVLLLIIGICAFDFYMGFAGETTVKDTVIGKERVTKFTGGHYESYYVIYGENSTYQVTDSWIKNRFDSSDMYGHIQENHVYEFNVIGKRIPILSHYQNIISYKELN